MLRPNNADKLKPSEGSWQNMEQKLCLALISSEQETSLMQLSQALRTDNSCHSVYILFPPNAICFLQAPLANNTHVLHTSNASQRAFNSDLRTVPASVIPQRAYGDCDMGRKTGARYPAHRLQTDSTAHRGLFPCVK